MENSKWIVVGISGVTNGGKSMLSKALHEKYTGSVLLMQDNYFFPEDSERHVRVPGLTHFNWDNLNSIDMDRMREDIANVLSRENVAGRGILFLDGFLLFVDDWISSVCNRKYFFTLPYEECLRRRSSRVYTPPDIPGYFEKCVWPEYVRNKEKAFKMNDDLCVLDGLQSFDSIIGAVSSQIDDLLKTNS